MSLVQSRQYMCEYGQNTYHLTERGEKSFATLSDPNLNINRYLNAKARENVGHSFEHIYDDAVVDTREEFLARHIQPKMREMDTRRREGYLKQSPRCDQRNKCCNRIEGVLY